MEKNFYLMVKVQPFNAGAICIEGSLNVTPSTQKELEDLRDAMYSKLLDLRYLVLINPDTSAEMWVPGSVIQNSAVTFQVVHRDQIIPSSIPH